MRVHCVCVHTKAQDLDFWRIRPCSATSLARFRGGTARGAAAWDHLDLMLNACWAEEPTTHREGPLNSLASSGPRVAKRGPVEWVCKVEIS